MNLVRSGGIGVCTSEPVRPRQLNICPEAAWAGKNAVGSGLESQRRAMHRCGRLIAQIVTAAGTAAQRAIHRTTAVGLDGSQALVAVICQQTSMARAADMPGQTPSAAEVRRRVVGKTLRAVLQPTKPTSVSRSQGQDPRPHGSVCWHTRRQGLPDRTQSRLLKHRAVQPGTLRNSLRAVWPQPAIQIDGPCTPPRPDEAGQHQGVAPLRQRRARQPSREQLVGLQGNLDEPGLGHYVSSR